MVDYIYCTGLIRRSMVDYIYCTTLTRRSMVDYKRLSVIFCCTVVFKFDKHHFKICKINYVTQNAYLW